MIIGHESQIAYLDRVLERGRLAHAYLFYGPGEIGKRTVALALAATLTCDERPKSVLGACGACRSCQSLKKGAHPAVVVVAPGRASLSGKELARDIPIDEVRALKRRLQYAPNRDEWRFVIIDNADRMTPEASNAFLKILEEPGERTVFVLVSERYGALPRTVVSRAEPVRFSLMPERIMELLAHRIVKSDAATLLRYAVGRPGRLVRLTEDEALFKREVRLDHDITACGSGSLSAVIRLAESVQKDSEAAFHFFERVIGRARENLLNCKSCGNICFIIFQQIRRLHRIADVYGATNVQPRLLFEAALITLGHTRHECDTSRDNCDHCGDRALCRHPAVSFESSSG